MEKPQHPYMLYMDRDLYKKLRDKAFDNGKPIAVVLREMIRQYVGESVDENPSSNN